MLDNRLAKQKTKRLLREMRKLAEDGINNPDVDPEYRQLLVKIVEIVGEFRRDINEDYQYAVLTHGTRLAYILEEAGLSFEYEF